MSYDPNEVAFGEDKLTSEEVFNFDSPEKPTPSSQEETGEGKEVVEEVEIKTPASDADSDVANKNPDEKKDDDEQRVPYSRFKKKVEEAEKESARAKALEEELARRTTSSESSDDVPEEWKQLYGDSELSRKAWEVQQKREAKLREEAVKEVLDFVKRERVEAAEAEAQKEKALDDYLSSLKESFGSGMNQAVEEELLSIVDEFSPTDKDGKYLTLISPEKAIEVFKLRHASKDFKKKQEREKVANLTSGKSQGEAERSAAPYRPSWDSWRSAL